MEQPKPNSDIESHVLNGDSAEAKGSGSGSGSGSESHGSMKKSVHWSPELVTESTFTSSPQGAHSNSSFNSASPSFSQPPPSFNVMGKDSVDFVSVIIFHNFLTVFVLIDFVCMRVELECMYICV